jgi:ubiquinone/menaquinone biosynthesis C-methylase UbiE
VTDRAAQSHWQRVYTEKTPTGVSWYQPVPERSLSLIETVGTRCEAPGPLRVIDVGGGASTLVDSLLQRIETQVCVVDIAAAALEHARARIGPELAARVRWVETDVTGPMDGVADGWADVWHDRAVFHFLTSPQERLAYARSLVRVLKPGGAVIIATFAPDGPERCSGLAVQRYDAASIAAELSVAGRAFTLVDSQREEHTTPWGSVQRFVYAVLRG